MQYFSTNKNAPAVSFKEATIKGQPPDKGLYFPESIPVLDKIFFENIDQYSKEEIAYKVIHPYVTNTMSKQELERIIAETVSFDFPLVKVEENIYSLELFHGPTLAFKDVGARFMSRCLGYFVKDNTKKVTVLVATSGDTGGAVASGFHNVEGIDVIILFPKGKVSSVQELQLTTQGNNVKAIEVSGTFDDCQQMVKQSFADKDLNESLFLTSANSINVARWLPQQFYYFFAYQQWKDKTSLPVISVPSGNFGNICAGLLAHLSGLPVKHFIAACNENNVVTRYLETGNYLPQKSIATLSNAMDVGSPSNFVRILQLFDKEFSSLKKVMSSYSFTNEETKNILIDIFKKDKYLADPHGAVAFGALKNYCNEHKNAAGIFLETAHPIKFYDVVEPIIQEKIFMPGPIQELLGLQKQSIAMNPDYNELKEYLLFNS